jgi:hypothetical protein
MAVAAAAGPGCMPATWKLLEQVPPKAASSSPGGGAASGQPDAGPAANAATAADAGVSRAALLNANRLLVETLEDSRRTTYGDQLVADGHQQYITGIWLTFSGIALLAGGIPLVVLASHPSAYADSGDTVAKWVFGAPMTLTGMAMLIAGPIRWHGGCKKMIDGVWLGALYDHEPHLCAANQPKSSKLRKRRLDLSNVGIGPAPPGSLGGSLRISY